MKERFARLPLPVHTITAKTPEEMFTILPALKRYFNSVTRYDDLAKLPEKYRYVPLDLVKIIKYIVFVYDKESDLNTDYPDDYSMLKDAAAREAGFRRREDGEWDDYVKDFMTLKDPQVVDWIMDYLLMRNNPTWENIRYLDEEIAQLQRQRMEAIRKGDIDNDYFKQVKTRQEERGLLFTRLHAQHTDLRDPLEKRLNPVSPQNVFKVLNIPDEHWKIRQVKDVPRTAESPETHNQGPVHGMATADTEGSGPGIDQGLGPEEE